MSTLKSLVLLDARALRCAREMAAYEPRADLTINQLPTLPLPLSTDLVPIYHNNQTYQIPLSAITALLTGLLIFKNGVATVRADGIATAGPTVVTFATAFPTQCLGAVATVDFGAGLVYALGVNVGNISASGIQLVAFGNPTPSSTCTVYWFAWGN